MTSGFRDLTGSRGEAIVELCLTDYHVFEKELFRLKFLGDKWPAIDFYVELTSVPGRRLYFFSQVKSTTYPLKKSSTSLRISSEKKEIDHLLQIPGPTYIFGVHEPSKRVFVRSVHKGIPIKAITRIPLAFELHSGNLQKLHDEVRDFWLAHDHKPHSSVFT